MIVLDLPISSRRRFFLLSADEPVATGPVTYDDVNQALLAPIERKYP